MSTQRREPGPLHRISVTQSPCRVTVSVKAHRIATTERALLMRETTRPRVYYVPEELAVPGVLTPSDTATYCPYKGDASYFDVAVRADSAQEATVISEAFGTYREPYEA